MDDFMGLIGAFFWFCVSDNGYAGTGADPGGTGLDHLAGLFVTVHPATGLNPHLRANDLAHQSDIGYGGPALAKSGRCFYKIGTCTLSNNTCAYLFFIAQ